MIFPLYFFNIFVFQYLNLLKVYFIICIDFVLVKLQIYVWAE